MYGITSVMKDRATWTLETSNLKIDVCKIAYQNTTVVPLIYLLKGTKKCRKYLLIVKY